MRSYVSLQTRRLVVASITAFAIGLFSTVALVGTAVAQVTCNLSAGPAGSVSGGGSFACGPNSDANGASNAVAIGTDADTSGAGVDSALSIGHSSRATGSNSIALGHEAHAFEDNAVAIGDHSLANQNWAIAIGTSAQSTSGGATAIGRQSFIGTGSNDSVAIGTDAHVNNNSRYSVAIGQGAHVTPDAAGDGVVQDAIAIGTDANAGGDGTTAIGLNTHAAFDQSTAIGANAVTTRAGQMAFGNASNTYTAAGITSAASKAAQSGPLQVVTTDAAGNLASDGGSVFDSIDKNSRNITKNSEGVAMALAMERPFVPLGQHFGVTGNWGTFEGENATAFGAAFRFNDHAQLDGGVGVGFDRGTVGGRAGLLVTW